MGSAVKAVIRTSPRTPKAPPTWPTSMSLSVTAHRSPRRTGSRPKEAPPARKERRARIGRARRSVILIPVCAGTGGPKSALGLFVFGLGFLGRGLFGLGFLGRG